MVYNYTITQEELDLCTQFARECAPTHRKYRSGGSAVKSMSQTEKDIFQGKVAEIVVKNYLESLGVEDISLDFENYGAGVWDGADIIRSDKSISIKSSKYYSRWLLLETKDIKRGDIYDYYIFVTIDLRDHLPSGEIRGYIDKETLLSDDSIVLHLQKGENIPRTFIRLDAGNYAVHSNNLFNRESDWRALIDHLRIQLYS